jgi:hypothetical protein
MDRYGLAMVVANTADSMGGGEGEVWIIAGRGHSISHVGGAKSVIASEILDRIVQGVCCRTDG